MSNNLLKNIQSDRLQANRLQAERLQVERLENNDNNLINNIVAEIDKFNDLNLENGKQTFKFDSNNNIDVSKKVKIENKDFDIINTYNYQVNANLKKIVNNYNGTYTLTVESELKSVILNTNYTEEYREGIAKNLLIDSILKCSGYVVNNDVPAELIFFNSKNIYHVLIKEGHIKNNDNTYSYIVELKRNYFNNSNIDEETYPQEIIAIGNKSIFNKEANNLNFLLFRVYL